jgi:sugar lactone lactonase YvrE
MAVRRVAASLALLTLVLAAVGLLWWWSARPRIRPLEPGWTGFVTTVAGSGVPGVSDGYRTDAQFSEPFGIVAGPDGSLFVSDAGDAHRIRKISPDGRVTTVAGDGRGFSDGAGAAARFDTPSGLAIDASGTLFVADTGNDAIRRITPDGQVTTICGPGSGLDGPVGIAVDPRGSLLVADTYHDRIVTLNPDGQVSTLAGAGEPGFADGPAEAARFDTPTGLALDAGGSVYVADTGNGAVRVIAVDRIVRTLPSAQGLVRPLAIATAPDGSLYVADDRSRVHELLLDGRVRVVAGAGAGYADGSGEQARFRGVSGLAVEAAGRLALTDRRNALVRRIVATARLDHGPPPRPIAPDFDAEYFARVPSLWPFAPFEGPFEITGTLGEPRGGVGNERLHAGLDVHAPEGTPVHVVRAAVVDHPAAVSELGSLNESVRIGPIAYVHLRVGRDRYDRPLEDERFSFTLDDRGRASGVRIRRGARFEAGEMIGTVNGFYHAHLNVGWPGEERNPLEFPLLNFEDTVRPTIAPKGITVFADDNRPLREKVRRRTVLSGAVRIVVDAWDQVNGNLARRRLGLYRLGYQVLNPDGSPHPAFGGMRETLRFDRHPADPASARFVYASGSGIPVYGNRRTRFLYLVTSRLRGGVAQDGQFDTSALPPGDYVLRILAADASGNEALVNRDLPITIVAPAR